MRGKELTLERFDPFDPRFVPDPYPWYHRLRALEPVHEGAPPFPSVQRCYYAFRYDDVVSILTDPRLGRTRPGARDHDPQAPRWIRRLGRSMVLFNDPPDHLRLRTLLATAFSPDFVQSRRPHIERTVTRLLDGLPDGGTTDLMASFAVPLPVLVIAAILGLPEEDADRIKEWSHALIGATDPRRSVEGVTHAGAAAKELLLYLRDIVRERERRPQEDLLSRMLLARRNGDRLGDDEVLANAMFLLSAGHETTVGLLGNGTLALMRNRSQWDRLVADPSLLGRAIEELLRYDSPIQMTFRFAAEPAILGERRLEPGDAVGAVLGAANRDPEVFADPDRLDIGRSSGRHLAFSLGTHFCMGPALARLEASLAFGALTGRFPALDLAGEPVWRETVSFRALERLPVTSGGRR